MRETVLVLPVLATGVVAWAQQPEITEPLTSAAAFQAADADGNGRLSRDEFLADSEDSARQQRRREFYDLDTDVDHELSLREFIARKGPAMDEFRTRNGDGDDHLTEAEFLQGVSEADRAQATRDFHVFDLDGDGALLFEEFLQIPSLVPREERARIHDPVVGLVDRQLSDLEAQWSAWDGDGDGGLDRKEFDAAGTARRVPGLALSSWEDWDRNRDGRVSREDCRFVLEIACGVRRADGLPLRTEAGFVVDAMAFRRIDLSNDERIDWQELLKFYSDRDFSGEYVRQRFAQANADEDDVITFAEWSSVPIRQLDTAEQFLKLDTNPDGRLDEGEFVSGMAYWRYSLAPFVFRGFDLNHDHALTLDEYRLTPFANLLERWELRLRDTDNDGRLGPGEFQWRPGLELSVLTAEYFRLFDLNQDGYLDQDEYQYNLSSRSQAPRSAVFRQWDRDADGRLTLADVLRSYKRGPNQSENAFQTTIARVEDAFHRADADGDGTLRLPEFESDAANRVVAPNLRDRNYRAGLSAGDATSDNKWRLWVLVGVNALLVMTVVTVLVRKKSRAH